MKEIIVSDVLVYIVFFISLINLFIAGFKFSEIERKEIEKDKKNAKELMKSKKISVAFFIGFIIDYILFCILLVRMYNFIGSGNFTLILATILFIYTIVVVTNDFKLSYIKNLLLSASTIFYFIFFSHESYNSFCEIVLSNQNETLSEILDTTYLFFKTFLFYWFLLLNIGIICNHIKNSKWYKSKINNSFNIFKNSSEENFIDEEKIESKKFIVKVILYSLAIPKLLIKDFLQTLKKKINKVINTIFKSLMNFDEKRVYTLIIMSLVFSLLIVNIILSYYDYSSKIQYAFNLVSTVLLIPLIINKIQIKTRE